MKKSLLFSLKVSLCTVSCLYASSSIAQAQVTSDGTLDTQVTQDGNLAEISGGETRGSNLFHSFQDFSVPTGNEAFFNNANDISNIFSRVTGGNISNIDGLIRANGSASLFLINPAGIIFGANARLDIGGSFYGSTASSILFEDGEFSAADLENPPLLTVNAPIGLGFRDNPGDITIRGDGNGARLEESELVDTQNALRVGSNATIGIIGGNVLFEDATIKTAGGRIEIGSVSEGTVSLIEVDNGFTFDYSGIETFGDISLSGRSNIDASGLGGGNIQVTGNNISIAGISGFSAVTLGSTPGKNINIFAANSLEISGVENEESFVSYISTRIFPNGTADAGDINIETGSFSIGDRVLIRTDASGQGNAGDISINAIGSVTLASQGNTSAIFAGVGSDVVGNAGNINITTSSLDLSNGAFINANTSGQGNAGNIVIDSNSLSVTNGSFLSANTRGQGNGGNINIDSANIAIDGQDNSEVSTGLFSNVGSNALGNAGNINITTESLTIANRGVLDTITSGQGNAGNINVNASNSIAVEGNDANTSGNTSIRAFALGDMAQGNAGDIELKTGSLTIDNGATLFVSGGIRGKGGNVTIDAAGDVLFANNSNINVTGTEGGSIDLNAKNLSIVSASNFINGIPSNSGFPKAQSGDININLEEDLMLDGLDNDDLTFISNTSFGIGNPGDINISARNITFQNGSNASIFSTSQQDGNIGEVNFNATGDIIFDGITGQRSGILNTIPEGASGDIGAINLQAQNLTITNGAAISSQVSGIANGGDINIDVANSIKIDGFANLSVENAGVIGSEISSNIVRTGVGDAGNISINTQNLELSRNGLISADVLGRGNGGDININAEQITIGVQGNPDTSPSFISAETFDSSEGNGGNITIDTGSLFISDGGDIDVGIGGVGNGGNININARDIVSVDGSGILFDSDLSSGIFADALNSIGNAGNIEIETAQLSVTDGAFISADILGSSIGDGGSITIRASDSIKVSGTGGIEVDILDENAQGSGGNLTLDSWFA